MDTTVEELRKQMRAKFPQAHAVLTAAEVAPVAGIPFEIGAFPAGGISEVIPAGPAAGVLLLVSALVGEAEDAAPHPEMVLIDGSTGFDPASYDSLGCSKLLWVRCATAEEMIKAADLLIHDGNVPFVVLDATEILRRDLAAIPTSAWLRMKQSAGRTQARVIVLADAPLVPCACLRLTLSADLSLRDFNTPRAELVSRLRMTVPALRRAT